LQATYRQLFGDPFALAVESVLPQDLRPPEMGLPWSDGEGWFYTGGPHGGWNSGSAWAALDFVPPDVEGGCLSSESWLVAVADGVIARSGHGAVVLDLDGDGFAGTGWAVTYMHVDSAGRIAAGTRVDKGQRLAHPGCEGGFTNGTHLHIARTYNGRWIAADGPQRFELDGWVSAGAGVEYNGWLERDGQRVTADAFLTDENTIFAGEPPD
jgi:murein DD-endopeptidase MepM/ murein hydrolase activator NlpD